MSTHYRNLLEAFHCSVIKKKEEDCFRYKEDGKWQAISWNEVQKKVFDLTAGLRKLGVKKGDKVAILSRTRYEWTLADLAIISCGAITVPIYESSLSETISYILENSQSKVVFVETDSQLAKVEKIHHELSHLKQAIVIESENEKFEEGIYSFNEACLLGSGDGEAIFNESMLGLKPEDDLTFVYTSGTTGNPKGAVLTHGNFLSEIEGLATMLEFPEHTVNLIFLPLAHILARVVQFAQLNYGFVQCYSESIDKLLDNIAEVRPHLMASVPRIFEKVHSRVMQGLETASPTKRKIFDWAISVGQERANLVRLGKGLSPALMIKWKLAYRLVFSKLHQKMGGRISYFISGGAPLSADIGNFFANAGFTILEGYGLTETTAAVSVNSRRFSKIGTVGKALPGVEIKIASDGEICVRGAVVFKGYYNRPEDTREALDKDGWFKTGDIGIIDSEGFVKITDRKKDIIVTAAGKNIAPQNIENLIKTDPLISQIMVHGDNRKFLSALVTVNRDEILNYAKNNKIIYKDFEDLVANDKIYQLIKVRIEDKNKHLAKYETIKKFSILPHDFSIESGELTPTLKVKRKFTSEKYKDILDKFYQESAGGHE